MPDDRPTCKTCQYWSPRHPHLALYGECRRREPGYERREYVDTPEQQHGSRWPGTGKDDWCGEHELEKKE